MKNYVKKLISSLMAISLVAPVFSGIPVFAENSDGTIVDQTQALTVVGKRIKGDDTYFEISLEVNEDHDNFSSVGVVLRYDPDYIIPAESWDEGAGAADMSENTTWATRRALPTLGLETWSTHTALAYQEDTPAPGAAGGKKYGYLYLGAEHPLAVEEPEATSDPSATAAPTADPSAPTAEPTASPQPGTRPVVVARFMYKTTAGDATATPPIAEVTGAAVKAKLTEDWTTGTNSSGSAEPINWDYDWTSNKILTIAGDDVAGKSPAQYPFAIYTQDYVEKAYMHTWPTVTPTATTAPGDPTPTPMPVSAYAPVIGTGVDAANHLTKDDIMIITCEGESAKATGGLKLSDIYVILFFDWDDSIIGTLTAGVGASGMNKTVSDYVKEKMVHTQLQDDPDYASLEREHTYRGEYPYKEPDSTLLNNPGGTGVVTDGASFPITNKLDYCFAGKTIDPDAPYACGWTQVVPNEVTYDPADYPGLWLDVQPKQMSEVFTALVNDDTKNKVVTNKRFARMPELDAAGALVNSTDVMPEMISFDFSTATKEMIDAGGGSIYVKAVYVPCKSLNTTTNQYSATGNIEVTASSVASAAGAFFSAQFEYRRVNKYGYGVQRAQKPQIKMDFKQIGASGTGMLPMLLENKDVMEADFQLTDSLEEVGYTLKETYQSNVNAGAVRSATNELGKIIGTGETGYVVDATRRQLIEQLFNINATGSSSWPITMYELANIGLVYSNGKAFTATTAKNATFKKNMKNFVQAATDKCGGKVPYNLTVADIQYGINNSGKLPSTYVGY